MPKPKDLSLITRNRSIQMMRDEGRTMQEIGDTVGLSRARVCQILADLDAEVTTDGYRAFLAAQVEMALAVLTEKLRAPDPIKVSSGGKVMYYPDPDDPSGRTPDYANPIYDDTIRIDAAKAVPALVDRLSKLRGADMRIPKDDDSSDYIAEYKAYVEQLIRDRNRMQDRLAELDPGSAAEIVDAEIIPDDPE